MSRDPKAMLESFLAIEASTIARDLRAYEGNVVKVVQSITDLRNTPAQDRTSEMEARIAHLTMIQAYALAQMKVELEFKVFYAAFGAGEVVQATEMASHSQGRLAEISEQMDAIRKREGLATDEHWLRHEGPADHQALEEESEHLFEEISDMMVVFALRRYHLGEYADLFENDRRRFTILRETAARVLMGSDYAASDLMDRHLAEEYGQDAVERIFAIVPRAKTASSNRLLVALLAPSGEAHAA